VELALLVMKKQATVFVIHRRSMWKDLGKVKFWRGVLKVLTWSVEGFDILQAMGLLLPSVPNTYKSFLYPLEPNPKQLEEFKT
jgi:hypothetical protein